MSRTRRALLGMLAPIAAIGLVAGSCTYASADTPGVTPTQILLGGTHPYSGPASAYSVIGKGIAAYFSYVNDKGGVYGRKIVYKDLDDAYSPPQTVQLVKGLVEQDHVLAIFNSLGTAPNLAIRQYLNDQKVPQIFASTGAATWGNDSAKYPWVIGFNLDYVGESIVWGRRIAKATPNAKIAVLYQNDDMGSDYLSGIDKGLAGHGTIVKKASYETSDPDVRSQMASLQSSGADTLLICATPKFAIQAMTALGQLNWKPTTYLSNISAASNMMAAATKGGGAAATEGIISDSYISDPSNPSLANTPGIKLYHEILSKYGQGLDPNNYFVLYGMAAAYTMVDALNKAGKDITREKLMNAAINMNENNPFLWPGVTVTTSPTDRFPIRELQIVQYHGDHWEPVGSVTSGRK